MRETSHPKASWKNNWNDLSTVNLESSDDERVRYSHRDTSSESEPERDFIPISRHKDLPYERTSLKEASVDKQDLKQSRQKKTSSSESERSFTTKKRTSSFPIGKRFEKVLEVTRKIRSA